MYPALSSLFTRVRQGLGERPTRSASSIFVIRPEFWSWARILRSIRSSFSCLIGGTSSRPGDSAPDIRLLEQSIERSPNALEDQIHLIIATAKRRCKSDDTVAEGAEDQAI